MIDIGKAALGMMGNIPRRPNYPNNELSLHFIQSLSELRHSKYIDLMRKYADGGWRISERLNTLKLEPTWLIAPLVLY